MVSGADLALIGAMVAAGCAMTYFLVTRKVRETVAQSHRELEQRLGALTELITMVEVRPTGTGESKRASAEPEFETRPAARSAADWIAAGTDRGPGVREDEDVSPEMRAAIAAAAVAMLGTNALVKSARVVSSQEPVSPWTQQGRMLVQASHNIRPRS